MKRLTLVVLLLLLYFAIRSYNLNAQEAFIDEGFHVVRSTYIWDFEIHPARVGHGKLLLYFWLGLFETEATQSLPIARLSIAIWSLLIPASLYGIGRLLLNQWAGLLAVLLYTILPWAVFFERMALADPFAAGFLGIAAWRSLIFARKGLLPHKNMQAEGTFLGLILGLMTLAKLTTGLLPFLPAFAALFFYPWNWQKNLVWQARAWFKSYFPPLVLAACILILMWLPTLIPNFLAVQNGEGFVLVDDQASRGKNSSMDTATYIEALPPVLYDFTHINWWRLIAGAWLVVGIFAFRERRFWQWSLFLMAWVFLLAILPITRAVLVRSRYFLPIAPPLTLLLALMIVYSWERAKGLSMGIGALTAIWAFSFALPFIWTDLNSPAELTFKTENWTEYTAGYFLSDAAVQQAAQDLNALNLTNERVYAPWNLCHLLYFHSTYPIQCLSRESPLGDINRLMRAEVGINESVYFVMADYSRLFFQEVENTRWQLISQYERQNIKRPVSLWQGWWTSGQH